MQINKPCCIDLYDGDNVLDSPGPLGGLDQVKRVGIFALIHKCTEGTRHRDQRYDARRAKWMTGSPVSVTDIDGAVLTLSPLFGAYHYLYGQDPAAEAANFLMTARLGATDTAWLDWEAVGASGYYPSIEAADTFCSAVEDALGRPCGVYGGNVPRELFAKDSEDSAAGDIVNRMMKRPLWFCAYGSVKLLTELPSPWKDAGPWLWQDDGDDSGPGPHTMPGISDYCDNSTVVDPMTFSQLHALWLGLTAAPAKPESAGEALLDELKGIEKKVEGEIADLENKLEGKEEEKKS